MDFYTWLMKQVNRDTALGDLARDAQQDVEFPREQNDLRVYVEHLETMQACDDALSTLRTAWSSYRRARRSNG